MNQILVGLTALHGWASGVPVSETANGHFLAMAAGSSAAVSVAAGVRIRQSSGALDYSYNTGAYARLLSKLTLASQATGDIMYASAADTWTRLAAGTDGHVLTLSGGLPTWAAGGGGGGAGTVTSVTAGAGMTQSGVSTVNPTLDVVAGNTSLTVAADSIVVNLGHAFAWTAAHTHTQVLGLPAGAVGAPALYPTGDTNTGLYFPAADQVALSTAGSARILIDSSTILAGLIITGAAGSASLPMYGFTSDPNTGAYSIGADNYGISAGGAIGFAVATTGATIYAAGAAALAVTAATMTETFSTANTVTALETRSTYCRSTGTAGVGFGQYWSQYLENASNADKRAGYMAWTWTDATAGSEDCDLEIALMAAGAQSQAAILTNVGAWKVGAGSASLPSLSFLDDPNTGWYSGGADVMSATIGGTARHKLAAAYARFALNGGVYKDSSAFEVIVGGAGADGRGRFENNISSTGVSGIISTNDNNWSGTLLLDGSGTTRTGVAGNTYFVGLTSQAHFGALTNTDSHWITGTADSTADRVASAVYNAGNRYLKIGYFVEYTEMSAPAAGAANTGRVFLVDNGSGKSVLKCQFATGAAQTMATEP